MQIPIYSRFTLPTYTRTGRGHGEWYAGDIPKWNLVWLSVPQLDLYLENLSLETIMASIDHEYVGTVAACVHPDVSHIFPTLREILSRPCDEFMSSFLKGPWAQLPAYEAYGMTWIDTMRERAQRKSCHGTARAVATATEQRIANNVVDFASWRGRQR